MRHVHFRRRRHECCVFDGVNERVEIGDVAALDFERTDPFSIVVWYKSAGAGFHAFCAKGFAFGGAGLGRGWEFSLLSGKLHTRIDHDDVTNGITVETTAAGFDDDTWRHAVLTYDGSSSAAGITMYANGAPVATTTIASTLTGTIQNTRPFELGAQDGGGFFSGYLDEVAVYDKELTAAEVTNLYNSGAVVDYTTLASPSPSNIAWYSRMAEGSVFPTLPDLSGNGNDGTMLNMQHTGPTRSRVLRP